MWIGIIDLGLLVIGVIVFAISEHLERYEWEEEDWEVIRKISNDCFVTINKRGYSVIEGAGHKYLVSKSTAQEYAYLHASDVNMTVTIDALKEVEIWKRQRLKK